MCGILRMPCLPLKQSTTENKGEMQNRASGRFGNPVQVYPSSLVMYDAGAPHGVWSDAAGQAILRLKNPAAWKRTQSHVLMLPAHAQAKMAPSGDGLLH